MKQHHCPNFRIPMAHPPLRPCRGLTLTEIIVTIAIGAVLLTISILALASAQRLKSQTTCATNLRNLGIAFQAYTNDNAGHYPQPSTSAQWEDLLRLYVHRSTFKCPGDQELFPALGSSYDWRDTADPTTSLAGRMASEISRGDVSLTYDALPSWHLPHQLQAAYTDGSVRMVSDEPFLMELQTPISSGSP